MTDSFQEAQKIKLTCDSSTEQANPESGPAGHPATDDDVAALNGSIISSSATKNDSACGINQSPLTGNSGTADQTIDGTNVPTAYKFEVLQQSIEDTIRQLLAANLVKQAEIASRLSLDLSDGRISPKEAQNVLQLLRNELNAQDSANVSKASELRRAPARRSVALAMAACAVILCVVALVFAVTKNVGRQAPFMTGTRVSDAISPEYQYLPASKEKELRSVDGQHPSTYQIDNHSKMPISLYWLNYGGERVFCCTIQPGAGAGENTFATHPFVVVDSNNEVKLLFVAGSKTFEHITVR